MICSPDKNTIKIPKIRIIGCHNHNHRIWKEILLELKRWADFPKWAVRHQKTLDETNTKILEAIRDYGPRNIKSLAESIGIPDTTVRFRIKKLSKQYFLLITARLDLSKLGLARGFLVAESPLARQYVSRQVIKLTDYWEYIARCYGKFDGFIASFAFPATKKKELEEYLKEAARFKAFSNYLFFWTTNPLFDYPCFSWYDFDKKQWRFRWDEWVKEALNSSEKLPEVLEEPKNYLVLVDESDLLILKELEKDATQSFRKIAKIIGITPQSVHYRWYNHIVKRKLILKYYTSFQPYPLQISDFYYFIIKFQSKKTLAKFSNSLNKKPFVTNCAKVIGKNVLVMGVNVPKMEFPNLISSLNSLYMEGLIEDFLYVRLDIMSHERQTISYEFFKNGEWSYKHQKKLRDLKELVRL